MGKNTELSLSRIKSLISSSPNLLIYILGLGGLLLIVGGLILGNKIQLGGSKVEVLQTPGPITTGVEKTKSDTIVIDVSGAVVKPGVYHLSGNDRVEDSIIAAGGLSQNADRNWVNKNLNRAAKLIDGQKIFVPEIQQSNVLGASNSDTKSNVAQYDVISDSNLVNINSASITDLDALAGIGQVYAQKIIDQRPYSDVSELVSKKVIPQSTFNKIKDKLSVY